MNPVLKNILAVIAGILVGGVVNSLLVNIGPSVIPLPEGADVSSIDKMAETMHLFEPKNFIFPFLGHAIGTLVGAFVAAKIGASKKLLLGIIVGAFYLIGGIAAVVMFGGPTWFKGLDLLVAYLPMGWLGAKLAGAGRA